MASVIGWLDYSEEHRQKMREIIDLFRDEDSIDELGIGAIRDTFSEVLFPGLSTIQTRARYFLLIPWVYKRIEAEKTPSAQASARARHLQTELVYALERGGATSSEGIIGWEARRSLQRLPSTVYWSGLKTFGIRGFSGSIEDYHRSLASYHRRMRDLTKGDGDEVAERLETNWSPHLPPIPEGLWRETPIELSREEADFLLNQIRLHRPESLLAFYLANPTPSIKQLTTPWDHPSAPQVPEHTRTWLHHARLFAEVMRGAAFAYNLMLAERAHELRLPIAERELDQIYREELEEWADTLDLAAVQAWEAEEMWRLLHEANHRLSRAAEAFAHRWISEVRTDPWKGVQLPSDLRTLISDRELRMKRGKARLHSHRALEMWSGRSGTHLLTYRWPTARTMIGDTHRGLGHA